MTEKIYVGTAREKTFPDGGSIIQITLSLDGMKDYYEKYGFETQQGKKKLKLNVSRRKEVDQYGHTHTVMIDTWKPDPNYNQSAAETPAVAADDFDIDDDVTF